MIPLFPRVQLRLGGWNPEKVRDKLNKQPKYWAGFNMKAVNDNSQLPLAGVGRNRRASRALSIGWVSANLFLPCFISAHYQAEFLTNFTTPCALDKNEIKTNCISISDFRSTAVTIQQ